MRSALPFALLLVACGASPATGVDGALPSDAGATVDVADAADFADAAEATDLADAADLDAADGGGPAVDLADSDAIPCVPVGAGAPVVVATASATDEQALTLVARSDSITRWSDKGNEALVLEVSGPAGLLGHLVLHQGARPFAYGMQVGRLAAGDAVSVRVSSVLSASSATPSACVGPAHLATAASLGAAGEGLANAPILEWPVAKRFDDLPIVLGWSAKNAAYQLVYTNENGGTVALCGGGAVGMQAELARWGRGADIEGIYYYGGAAGRRWERCDGVVPITQIPVRYEGAHPILYYGDGHNRLFESRGGYGQVCGTSSDKMADGDLVGWNVQNPGNGASQDAPFVITLRPLPVGLDPLGFPSASGRREALLDKRAPWLYRLVDEELRREGKVDGTHMLPMERYLYVDVHAFDVNGSGDRVCALTVSGGFVLRAVTSSGVTLDGPQMTADYFGGALNWKRLAIPLDQLYTPAQIPQMIFDAYDGDGIYFLDIGDAFMVRPDGDNGATLLSVRTGVKPIDVFVDDNNTSCTGGQNYSGPTDGGYPCVGGYYPFSP